MSHRESTNMADATGRELFVGDVVETEVEEPFRSIGVHGRWTHYEIAKAPGGYVLSYLRSETGPVLPLGYLSCYMTEFRDDELPDRKVLLMAKTPVKHPALKWIEDTTTPDERAEAFTKWRRGGKNVTG